MAIYNNFKDLAKAIEKEVKKELKKNPNKYLDSQAKKIFVGEKTKGFCKVCNSEQNVEILKGGKVKCLNCNNEFSLDIKWDIK